MHAKCQAFATRNHRRHSTSIGRKNTATQGTGSTLATLQRLLPPLHSVFPTAMQERERSHANIAVGENKDRYCSISNSGLAIEKALFPPSYSVPLQRDTIMDSIRENAECKPWCPRVEKKFNLGCLGASSNLART